MNRVVFNRPGERESLFRADVSEQRDRLTVEAGTLRAFGVGAIVAVHSQPHVEETLIGTGSVESATATQAVVNDITWDEYDADAEAEGCQGSRCVPARHQTDVYVRLVQPAYRSQVLISQLETVLGEDNQRLGEMVAAIERKMPLVEFVDYYDPGADYFVAVFDDRFWLLRPSQDLPCSVRAGLSDEGRANCESERREQTLLWSTVEDADRLVLQAARARSLAKLQEVVSPLSLGLDLHVKRPNRRDMIPLGDPLHAGDVLLLDIRNYGNRNWDLLLFYVDSQLGITALQEPGHSVRVLSGERIDALPFVRINDATTGIESVVAIVEPVPSHGGLEADYHFLTQEIYNQMEVVQR